MDYYGNQLRAVLKEFDFSQFKLALTINKSPQFVNALVNNRKKASDKVMQQIADKIGISLDELKNYDSLIQTNSSQKGGSAANIIVQHSNDASMLQTALDRAYEEIEFWKSEAKDKSHWMERALKAEISLTV